MYYVTNQYEQVNTKQFYLLLILINKEHHERTEVKAAGLRRVLLFAFESVISDRLQLTDSPVS